MKKTKLYAKKTLSVFMAVMMLMTAWVFVAPEKASAVTLDSSVAADVAPATTYATYHVRLTVNFSNIGKSGNIIIYYYPVNADGSLNTSVRGEYKLVNSASQYSSTTYTFDTADDTTRALGTYWTKTTGKDYGAEHGPVQGWPCGVKLQSVSNWGSSSIALTSCTVGNKSVTLNNGSWSASGGNTKEILYNNTGSGWDGYLDWPVPAVSQVTAPTAQTINVPKGGSNSATFTATFYDQYGAQWPSTSGMTATLSPALSGASVQLSGNYATVTGNMNVFNNAAYNSENGQIKTKLNMTQGGVTASCDVTFQAPKYNAYLNDFAGNTVKTYSDIGYYNQSVTLTGHPANTAPAQIAGNAQQHQTYIWPTESYSAFNIDKDTTFTEITDKLVDHTYGAWTQNADDHTRTCSTCGYVHTQAHINGTGYVTKAETCTENGVMTYDCAVCGKKAIATSDIDNITGHNFTGAYILRTDGENGTHWKKCSRCDAYGLEAAHNWDKNGDGVIDANDAETKASTCEVAGYEKYTCQDNCGATWTKTLTLEEHKTTATPAKDVTNICGGDGNVAFWTCKVCNKIFTDAACTTEVSDYTDNDNDDIPDKLEVKGPDHNFIGAYVNVKDGADGAHYRQCERFTQCGAYGLMVDGKAVVNATEPHKFTSTETASSCTVKGTRTYTCSDCTHSYTEELPLAAHKMTKHERKEAECNKPGNVEYYSCSVCNKNYDDEKGTNVVENIVIPALQHKWTVHHDYDELKSAATCMSPAIYHDHCDYCKVQLQGTHEVGTVDKVNGHKFEGTTRKNDDGTHSYACIVTGCTEYGNATKCVYEVTKDVASTCKTAGYTTYECKDCHNGYSDTKDLDPLNHKGEGTEVREQENATCATNGYTGDTHCLGCGEKLETGSEIPADPEAYPHEDMKLYEAKNSTCQKEGWKEYKYCSACNTYEIAKETVAKKEHKFTTYTPDENADTHTAICDTCDPNVAEPETDTQDCTGGKANCVDKAVCTVCGDSYGALDSTNHKTVKTAAKVDSTCQKEGTEAYRYCEACGNDIETRVAIEKKDHIFGAWTKLEGEDKHTRSCTTCKAEDGEIATETKDCNGGIAYCNALAKCADCKAEYGDYDEDNHSTEANTLKGKVDATCQAPGYTGDYHYNCCDAIKEKGTATEQLAHTFSIEVEGSRVDATCIAKGEVTYKCSTCVESEGVNAATEKKVLPIDAKNHATPDKTVTIGAKDATCEEDGHTGDVYYECCYDADASAAENKKALKEKGTTIKANGQHVYDAAVPEYMIAEIRDVKDEDGNVTGKEIVLKDTEPAYADKIKARRDDDKWYHAKQCTICGTIEYEACYTYEHTYSCVDTDTCEVCEGLCSLKDPDKHTNIVKVPKVEATHTTDGTKEYYKCEDCGKFFLDEAGKKPFDPATDEGKELIKISKDTVPCTEWEKDPFETVDPKCGQDGYKKYHCAVEGCDKVKTEVIPAESDSHTWSEDYKVIKEPTCGAVGYKTLYCTVCDEFKPNSTVTISATGEHNYKLVDTDKGTSCLDPTIETYKCEVCGAEKTETVYDGDANHNWGEWEAVGGDCSTGIIQQRECSVCHEKQQQTVTTDTHDYALTTRVEPTPEADGYAIYTCKNCGAEKREELPYSGSGEGGTETDDKHLIDENNYTVAKEASCDHGEIRRYVCLRCGETVEKEIEGTLLDHVWLEQAEEKATCAKDGHSAYYRCVRCLAEYGEGKEIYPATGHKDGNGDGKCDSCNSAFYEDGNGSKTCGCICHKEGFLMKIIYKIVRFFWKLFKIGHSCDCGAVHY